MRAGVEGQKGPDAARTSGRRKSEARITLCPMIYPAPTSKIDPTLARGVLEAVVAQTATQPGHIVVSFPNTSYQMHLLPRNPVASEVGKRIIGTVRLQARRIDHVQTGGRYVEPVYGRPRRVQGSVISVSGDALVVDATVPVHVSLTDPRQKASDFKVGDFVSFDALDGASFAQA
jgi:hypothetical protein